MVVNVVILRERDLATIKATDLQPGIYVTSFPENYHNHCQYEDVGPYHEWGGEKAGHSNCFVCGTSTTAIGSGDHLLAYCNGRVSVTNPPTVSTAET